MNKIFLITALVVFATTTSLSQSNVQEADAAFRLKLAQSSEQAGEWERAVGLYEGLYRSDQNNDVYFDGLRRGYSQLRLYDKAVALVIHQLSVQSTDVGLLASLGGLYYESGNQHKADSVWDAVIKRDPRNQGLYRLVASQMMEHRLFEEAVTTFRAGRKATENESLFADELASLFYVLQQYGAATAEYVKMLLSSPQQLSFIQSRIASFTLRAEGLRAATEVAKEEVKKTPENVTLRKFYAWLAMEGKDYRAALDEYRIVDRLSKSNGAELFGFARRASQDKVFRIAEQAFKDIIEGAHSAAILSQARFGYARAVEDVRSEADTSLLAPRPLDRQQSESTSTTIAETEKSFQNVLQLYQDILKDYPNSDLAAQAYYRIGILRTNRFYDFDGALEAFDRVKGITRGSELACEASLRIAEVYVMKNNLSSARAEYEGLFRGPIPPYKQQAYFSIAELDYFEGNMDSSLAKLKQLSANLSSDLSNDVLLLQYFILENKSSSPAALNEFAKADLMMRQRKYAEALEQFDDVVKNYPASLVIDDATMKMGELQVLLNRTNDAIATFRHLVNDMPESILKDRAQMKIAEAYEYVLKDKLKAIETYEQFLVKFPNSLYVEEARKRIRHLRGDYL